MTALGQKPAFGLLSATRGSDAVGGTAEMSPMETIIQVRHPWNKGLIVGQKRPLLPRRVWSIRVRPSAISDALWLAEQIEL